jgi:hypothetical protein
VLLKPAAGGADARRVMDDMTIPLPRRGTARFAAGLAAAALLAAGTTAADAARRIAPAKLMCDARAGTAKAASGAARAGCVKRPAKALKRSVVRREFPTFGAQVRSDPRVVLSGGRALVARRTPAAVAGATARTHTSDSSSSSPKREQVSPVLECVSRDGAKYVAHFGYSNKNTSRVEIAVGSSNRFTPGENLGQPTLFQPGRLVDVFRVTFAGGNLVWTLDGRTATASPSSKACATPPAPAFFPDQVAVVPLDATAGGAEYQGLRTVGVPVVIAPTIADAVRYRIVILAGAPSPGTIGPEDLSLLSAFATSGGVLIGEAVTDPKLFDIFGIAAAGERTDRSAIDWVARDETIAELDRPTERHVDIDDRFGSAFRTVGYADQKSADVLARFDDGTAAVIRRCVKDGGSVYAIGARLTDLVTRHHEGARWSARAQYQNAFDTSADGWLLWLRGVYRAHVDGGVTMSTTPAGKRFAVLPTLSLNFSAGVGPTADYVREAADRQITPTVFVWTKVVTDWLDVAFFSDSGPFDDIMHKAKAQGAEIAAQTVAHSPVLDKLPMGTGTESYPAYQPFVASKTLTTGATVLGEIRVSRQLLQSRLNPRMTSFRAGYLLTTPRLAVAEEAAAIRDDSSTTQGWVGGALPFSIPRFDGTGYADVTTFPVVVEDERGVRIDQRLDEARDLIEANGDNGAPSVILFHPNGWDWKLKAWDKLLMSIPGDAWTGTVQRFGDFWQDRGRAALVTSPSTACDGGRHVEVRSLNAAWPVRGQVLDVAGSRLEKLVLPGNDVRYANGDRKVTLPDIAGGATLSGELCP